MLRTFASVAVATIATGLLASCSSPSAPADEEPKPSVDVAIGFAQWLPDEGTERGMLRVTNRGEEDLEISRIGIDWPRLGGEVTKDEDATLFPGQTLDLRITLPKPVCDAGAAKAVGIVESGDTVVRHELVPVAQVYLGRLWQGQCARALVERTVDLRWGSRWVREGTGRASRVVGTLELRRLSGDDRVEVESVEGSVLYGLALPGRTALEPGRSSVSVPVALLPGNRCDEHARGQATAPFDFVGRVRVGDAALAEIALVPPARGRAEGSALLDRVCGKITTAG